jgi:hypothetical protein
MLEDASKIDGIVAAGQDGGGLPVEKGNWTTVVPHSPGSRPLDIHSIAVILKAKTVWEQLTHASVFVWELTVLPN